MTMCTIRPAEIMSAAQRRRYEHLDVQLAGLHADLAIARWNGDAREEAAVERAIETWRNAHGAEYDRLDTLAWMG